MEPAEQCNAGNACGTPTGWRKGGRCPACRRAHNEETNRYRGLTDEQVERAKDLLRDGATIHEAATAVGCKPSSITSRAARDDELAALLAVEGAGTRTRARKGVFLASLLMCGEAVQSARSAGVSVRAAYCWRDDPHFAAAWDAVLAAARQERNGKLHPLRKEIDAKRLRALWTDRSLTVHQVAALLGVSYPTLKRNAVSMGLPRRPRGARRVPARDAP